MSLFNIYKTLCDGLGLAPVNGSYVQALGNHFNVVDAPGKRYEDEVLVAAIINYGGVPGGCDDVTTNQLSACTGTLNVDASTMLDITSPYIYLHNTSETTYLDIASNTGKIQAYAQDGISEVTLDLDPSNYNTFRTNGSAIYLSIDNLSFSNSNMLLQNNSAALRCYSANADVQVTAGSNAQGLILDRNTQAASLFNNEGIINITSTDQVSIQADAGVSIIGNGSDVEIESNGAGATKLISQSDNIILNGSSTGLPVYANDAAADADADLQSGALYKVTGSRAVFQKP